MADANLTNATLMTVVNHIFVDFENMKKVDTTLFALERATTVTLFLGRQNHSLDTITVGALLKAPRAVELIRIEREGRDAVDFTLVFLSGTQGSGRSDRVFPHRIKGQGI